MQAQSWAAFAAFVLLITVASPARADQDVLARARLQTFVVEVCPGPGNAAAIGSGVVVGRSGDTLTIATAAHILRQRGALRILDASRQAFYDVLDVQLLDDYDLGLVRVRAQNAFPVAPASFAPALPGEPV